MRFTRVTQRNVGNCLNYILCLCLFVNSVCRLKKYWVYSGTSLRWTPLGRTIIVRVSSGRGFIVGYILGSVSVPRDEGCPLRGVPLYI